MRLLGSAGSETRPDAGALARLDPGFLTLGVGMITDPGMGPAINAFLDQVSDALAPWDSQVKYANFVEVPIDARARYPPETFERLQQVKARYDPDDLFRANPAIPCPAPAG